MLRSVSSKSITISLLFGLLLTSPAPAHDWYPIECCSGMDCAPVDRVQLQQPIEISGMPIMVVTTKVGTTIIPKDYAWRESKDGRMHACIKVHDKNPQTNFLCAFMPPGM